MRMRMDRQTPLAGAGGRGGRCTQNVLLHEEEPRDCEKWNECSGAPVDERIDHDLSALGPLIAHVDVDWRWRAGQSAAPANSQNRAATLVSPIG